ncbi:MAG: hypothetical protein L6V93_05500 [Clostridiales bacterium]|nr:MAG: hypothetical protein L6V93_05500 [Clostridiales bacterium]
MKKAPVKIANGEFKGQFLKDVIEKQKPYYGQKNGEKRKRISASFSNFSMQIKIYPFRCIPRAKNGKTEMWYIVDAKEGAKIGFGFVRDVTKRRGGKSRERRHFAGYYQVLRC